MTEKTKDFESSLKKLEKIVSELEEGDLPLEKSINCLLYTSPSPRDRG